MPELVPPAVALHESWLDARDDWGRGVHQDGSGLHPADEVDTPAGFAAWVSRLLREADRSVPAGPGRVHATYFWVVAGDAELGSIALRHTLTDFLLRAGGHVGYGIRPSARRLGSAGAIEKNVGVLEDVRPTELGLTRRYWIAL